MDLVLDVLISLYRVLQKGFYLVLDLTSWPGPIHANYFLGNLYLIYKIMPLIRCRGECHEYAFFGVQAWNWCWCGNTAPPANRKKSEDECNINCPGDSDKKCGGHWRMNIYKTQGQLFGTVQSEGVKSRASRAYAVLHFPRVGSKWRKKSGSNRI